MAFRTGNRMSVEEQERMTKLLALLSGDDAPPELQTVANNYKRKHKEELAAFDSKPYTTAQIIADGKAAIARKSRAEIQTLKVMYGQIQEMQEADEEKREEAEGVALANRMYATATVVRNKVR